METTFGENLFQLRRKRKKLQKAVAYAAGLDPSYVASLENGRRDPPRREILDKLCDALAAFISIPAGNGKTTLIAGLALYGLRFGGDALIPVAASSRDQARIMYRQAKGFVRRSRLDDDGFEFQAFDGYRRIDLRGPGRTVPAGIDGRRSCQCFVHQPRGRPSARTACGDVQPGCGHGRGVVCSHTAIAAVMDAPPA